jgi:phage tail-like protein
MPARPHDPVLNHNFVITLLDSASMLGAAPSVPSALAGFSECSGLEMSMQPEEYKEGGNNATVLKFASRVTWGNLTLRRGVSLSSDLWDWHYGFVEGRGKRRDGVVILLDETRAPARRWCFRRGLPIKYTAPQLNAAQSGIAIEAIEIAHEGIFQLPAGGGGGG